PSPSITPTFAAIDFNREGTLMAWGEGSNAHGARVYDVVKAREICFVKGHKGNVEQLVFHPDGKRLATASADGTVKVWDLETGKEVRTFDEHAAKVRCVAFSPDGRYLASGADDGTILVWELEWPAGRVLRTFTFRQQHSAAVQTV